MHILIINFALEGISAEEYGAQVESAAPAFAELPGLVSKIFLANEQTNSYGGVYLWQDREAMEDYKESELYKGMAASPYFKDFTVKDFAVPEGPTRMTRGWVEAASRTAALQERRIMEGRCCGAPAFFYSPKFAEFHFYEVG